MLGRRSRVLPSPRPRSLAGLSRRVPPSLLPPCSRLSSRRSSTRLTRLSGRTSTSSARALSRLAGARSRVAAGLSRRLARSVSTGWPFRPCTPSSRGALSHSPWRLSLARLLPDGSCTTSGFFSGGARSASAPLERSARGLRAGRSSSLCCSPNSSSRARRSRSPPRASVRSPLRSTPRSSPRSTGASALLRSLRQTSRTSRTSEKYSWATMSSKPVLSSRLSSRLDFFGAGGDCAADSCFDPRPLRPSSPARRRGLSSGATSARSSRTRSRSRSRRGFSSAAASAPPSRSRSRRDRSTGAGSAPSSRPRSRRDRSSARASAGSFRTRSRRGFSAGAPSAPSARSRRDRSTGAASR